MSRTLCGVCDLLSSQLGGRGEQEAGNEPEQCGTNHLG